MISPFIALYVCWSVWAILWIATAWWSARTVRRAGGRRDAAYKLFSVAGMLALMIVTRPTGPLFMPLWRLGTPMEWSMVGLTATGFAFACWARLSLGKLWSAGVVRKADHQLVDEGPYAIVRHPIYTGLLAAALALALVKATPLALFGFLLTVIGFTIKARLEEQFLTEELGREAYDDYRRRVPMLVPFLPSGASVAG